MADEAAKRLLAEERVIETVRQILPELTSDREAIHITLADHNEPDVPEGATFTVERRRYSSTFACRRG